MKALIAMSGGVDSSVAAYLMQQKGCDCIGCTMRLYDNETAGIDPEKSCCSLESTEDARSVARRMGIPYYVFNYQEAFRESVIGPFIRSYESGCTPNPCIECNRCLKFGLLYERMRVLGCDCIVTGHYARISRDPESGRYLLLRAADPGKDQSYVLYSLTQEQLRHTAFPLGEYRKEETRAIAAAQGFCNAERRDSQDICFVPDGDYAAFLSRTTGKQYAEGSFVDREGREIGRHKGYIHYTIGQRRGLGIAWQHPLYVTGIDPERNIVTLGKNEELFRRELTADRINLISVPEIRGEMRVQARIRYHQAAVDAVVTQPEPDLLHVVFREPQRAVTPGQAVVLYDGERVVGGGTIRKG